MIKYKYVRDWTRADSVMVVRSPVVFIFGGNSANAQASIRALSVPVDIQGCPHRFGTLKAQLAPHADTSYPIIVSGRLPDREAVWIMDFATNRKGPVIFLSN